MDRTAGAHWDIMHYKWNIDDHSYYSVKMFEPQSGGYRVVAMYIHDDHTKTATIHDSRYLTREEALADMPRLCVVCENWRMEQAL